MLHSPLGRALSDRLLGPQADRQDAVLAFGSALLLTSLVIASAGTRGVEWSMAQWGAAAVLAFDLFGGVAVNASPPARRYYFRPERGPADHLAFVAVHIVHILAFSWLFRGGDWIFAIAVALGLVLAAAVILFTPEYRRRPVAMLLLTLGVVLSTAVDPTPGMEWFVPVLLIKLLVCYLLGDVPAAPRTGGAVVTEPPGGP